ncbi:MAG TPA: cysteine desulfurase family protein [Candidatus Nanopelagicaceae bacterium]|nr:cysteine desulfurase family protein [Candidatus Nanopelagicaceae bacterium]
MIYLDHAATTPVREEVRRAIGVALEDGFGNPSSTHQVGRQARALVDRARDQLAAVLHCRAREIVLTGGGSEADNLALRGVARRARGRHLIVSAVEHEAVIETARDLVSQGFELTVLAVDEGGRVRPDELARALREDTFLVSVMLANNEVGTIQPIAELVAVTRERSKAYFHTDATQALGKLSLDVNQLGVDMLTVSAHKVYGPKGAGALYVRQGTPLDPVITGGGQERNRRSGTENVPGIVGLGVAAELAEAEREVESRRQAQLSQRLTDLIVSQIPGAVATGAKAPDRLPNFATIAFPGVEGELLLLRLDRLGVCASAGSACSSGSLAPSHVLLAMGLPPARAGAHLRLTVGRQTSSEDVARAAQAVVASVRALQVAVPAG